MRKQPGSSRQKPHRTVVIVTGIPFDVHSSFARGAALAPARIREALYCDAGNLCTESGRDLGEGDMWQDIGDLHLPDTGDALQRIEDHVRRLLAEDRRVLALGGDHAVTYPILRAYAERFPSLNVLHLDAHPDLYDELNGDRFSHACPFARIMEEKQIRRLVQIGIRTATPHQQRQAARFGVETIRMPDWRPGTRLHFNGPLYVSIDLDCLDPAFAPGVSHHEPGGLSTRELIRIIQGVTAPVVGADIVEYNPRRDVNGVTAVVAAKLLKELIDLMAG